MTYRANQSLEDKLEALLARLRLIISSQDNKNALISIEDIDVLQQLQSERLQLLEHVTAAQNSLLNAMSSIINKS